MNYLDYLNYVEKEILKAEDYKNKIEEERKREQKNFRDMISAEGLDFIPDLLPEKYRKMYYIQINNFHLKIIPIENKLTQLREIERRLKLKIENEIEKNILSDKKDKKNDYNYVSLFMETIKNKCKNIKWPTYEELSELTGISEKTWKRRFKDILFLENILRETNKILNQQKSEKTKKIWEERLEKINNLIEKVRCSKDALNRKTIEYNDNKKYNNPNSGSIYADLEEAIEEDINR